jgi:steroid delta-isomerase
MPSEDAALTAARNSWKCVMSHDKEGWLALMAEDVCVEDPIGVGPTNPTGEGVKGKAAMAEFYDKNIRDSSISIEAHESYYAGLESAHKLTLTTTLSNGVVSKVTSIFTYRVDDEGLITNLRGYWKLSDMTFTQPD